MNYAIAKDAAILSAVKEIKSDRLLCLKKVVLTTK